MRKLKIFLTMTAIFTAAVGWYLIQPDVGLLKESLSPANLMSSTPASESVPILITQDQTGSAVGGVTLEQTYTDADGKSTTTTVTTGSDGKLSTPTEDGTYTYSLDEVPDGYVTGSTKVIAKVTGSSVSASKTMTIVKYTGSDRSDAQQNAASSTQTDTSTVADKAAGETIVTEKASNTDQSAADAVALKIKKLGNDITSDDKDQVEAARKAYNGLTDSQKLLIESDTYKLLTNAEDAVGADKSDREAAAAVSSQLEALGTITKLDQAESVEAAQSAYDALTENQKSYVTSSGYSTLVNAQSALTKLRKDTASVDSVNKAINALGDITSLDQSASVTAARNLYDALDTLQQAKVSDDTYKKLLSAETKISELNTAKSNAAKVTAKIATIGDITSVDQKSELDDIQSAYDKLSDQEKAFVPDESKTVLTSATARMKSIQEDHDTAEAFSDAVRKIGNVTKLDQKDAVTAARTQYDKMTQTQQSLVSNDIYSQLQTDESKIDQLQQQADAQAQKDAASSSAASAAQSQTDTEKAAADKAAADEAAAEQAAADQAAAEEAAKQEAESQNTAAASDDKPDVQAGDIEGWRPWVIRALEANGLEATDDRVNKVLRQINTESGGDQNIVQLIYDSNSGWVLDYYHCDGCATSDGKARNIGHGLMQTILTTFDAYKFEGHDDIFNGYDNLLAAINYAKNAYGDNLDGLGEGHGY